MHLGFQTKFNTVVHSLVKSINDDENRMFLALARTPSRSMSIDDIIAESCAPKDACTFPDSKEIDVILRSSRRHSEA